MISLIGITLGAFFCFLIYFAYKNSDDFFSPTVIFLILEFIAYVPGMFLFESESSIKFTPNGCFKVMAFEMLYVISVLFGIGFSNNIKVNSHSEKEDIPLFNILVFFFIGFGAKLIVINKLGGLTFVLTHGQYAYLMQSHGYGIYTIFYKFMVLAIIALFDKMVINKGNHKYKILLLVMVLIYAASFLIYTSRTPAFIMILMILFFVNFEVKKFNLSRLLKPKMIVAFLLCAFVAYSATLSRKNNSGTVSDSMFGDLFYNYTSIGRDICTYDYFESHEKWFGKGYLNIIPSLIPGVESKPSTDDGIYLVNIIRGQDVDINANSNELVYTTGSVPFSTPGYMYANFGVFGIILGGLIMGILMGLIYKFMCQNLNAFNIAIYFYIVYSFGLSTGRMVPTLISIIFIFVFKQFIRIHISNNRRMQIEQTK